MSNYKEPIFCGEHAKKKKKKRRLFQYYKGLILIKRRTRRDYLVIGSKITFHLRMLNFDDVKNLLREGLRDEAEHAAELQADLQQFG